jgi:Fe2+ or Zn2+ uptake regulation protein
MQYFFTFSPEKRFNKKSNKTVRRYLKILKDKGLIECISSKKTGRLPDISEQPPSQENRYDFPNSLFSLRC